jgi:hypothetical protein
MRRKTGAGAMTPPGKRSFAAVRFPARAEQFSRFQFEIEPREV